MKNIIVPFGKPGAGKGTWISKFVKGQENLFEVLSVSGLLRNLDENTEYGKIAKSYMNSGSLVPDKIVNGIVIESIKKSEKSVILDGYPRTLQQLDAMLNAGIEPTLVIVFHVDDEIIIKRAADRIVCSGCGEPYTLNEFKRPKKDGVCDKCGKPLKRRADDEESLVRKRLVDFENETYPILERLKNKNITIFTYNANETEVDKKLKQLLIK